MALKSVLCDKDGWSVSVFNEDDRIIEIRHFKMMPDWGDVRTVISEYDDRISMQGSDDHIEVLKKYYKISVESLMLTLFTVLTGDD